MMPVSILRRTCVPAIAVLLLAGGATLVGQRGGGARGGGARGARTSVNRSFGGGGASRSFSGAGADRSFGGASASRSVSGTSGSRSVSGANVNRNFNSANVNRNFNSANVNRNFNNVNVDRDINVDGHYGGWGDACCYHPVARAAGVAAAAATTAAVVGSVVNTLPPACSEVNVNGVPYQQCGSTWYQPQFVGTTVNYVVVNSPR
jgi:hypothetical protein